MKSSLFWGGRQIDLSRQREKRRERRDQSLVTRGAQQTIGFERCQRHLAMNEGDQTAWRSAEHHGHVRDLRARWAPEEIGLPYRTRLISTRERLRAYFAEQPCGQVPAYHERVSSVQIRRNRAAHRA